MKAEIDYLFDGCTDLVAYSIKLYNEQGLQRSYISPFVFNSVDDAYHAACIELSGQ